MKCLLVLAKTDEGRSSPMTNKLQQPQKSIFSLDTVRGVLFERNFFMLRKSLNPDTSAQSALL